MTIPVKQLQPIRLESVPLVEVRNEPSVQAIDDGLVGHWSPTLQADQGGVLFDRVGDNDLPIGADVAWDNERLESGGSWSLKILKATTGHRVGPSSGTAPGEIRTASFWVGKLTTGSSGFLADCNTPSRFLFAAQDGSDNNVAVFDGAWKVTSHKITFTFQHIAFVNRGAGSWDLIVNGVLTDTIPTSDCVYGGPFVLGNRYEGTGGGLYGYLDTVRFYNRSLTSTEVQTLSNAGRNEDGLPSGPVNTAPPSVVGIPYVGGTLQTTVGTYDPAADSYTYAWEASDDGVSGWTTITGETTDSYVVRTENASKFIRSSVTATVTGGGSTVTPSAAAKALPEYILQVKTLYTSGTTVSFDSPTTAGSRIYIFSSTPTANRRIEDATWNGSSMEQAYLLDPATHAMWLSCYRVVDAASAQDIVVDPNASTNYHHFLIEVAESAIEEAIGFRDGYNTAPQWQILDDPGITYPENCFVVCDSTHQYNDVVAQVSPPSYINTSQASNSDRRSYQGYAVAPAEGFTSEILQFTSDRTGRGVATGYVVLNPGSGGGNPPVNTTPPGIDGTLKVGETLQVIPGVWT